MSETITPPNNDVVAPPDDGGPPGGPPANNGPSAQDTTFVQTILGANQLEIDEANLALTKSSNIAVTEYARWMIADHTLAGNQLTTIANQEGIPLTATTTTTPPTGTTPTNPNTTTNPNVAGPNNVTGPNGTMDQTGPMTGPGTGPNDATNPDTTTPDDQTAGATTPAQQAELASLQSLTDPQFSSTYITNAVTDHAQAVMVFLQETKTGQDPALVNFAQQFLPVVQAHLDEAIAIQGAMQGKALTQAEIDQMATSLVPGLPPAGGTTTTTPNPPTPVGGPMNTTVTTPTTVMPPPTNVV